MIHVIKLQKVHTWRQVAIDIGSDISNGPWIAGGAARRLYQNETTETDFTKGDIDIFFPLSTYLETRKTAEDTLSKYREYSARSNDKRTVTHQLKIGERPTRVQIIGEGHRDLSSLFASFDFTVSQFAVSGEFIAFTDEARDDLEKMKLALVLPVQKRKGTTPVRINKYCSYGFTPAPGVLRWVTALDRNKVGVDMHVIDEDVNYVY